MAARKSRPVLFEVVARTQRARNRGIAQRPSPPSVSPGGASSSRAASGPYPTGLPASPAGRLPVLSVQGGRVHLTLGWLHCTAIAALVVVLLVLAYQAGRRSVQSASGSAPDSDLEKLWAAPAVSQTPPAAAPPVPAQGRAGGPIVTPAGPVVEPSAAIKPQPAEPVPAPSVQPEPASFSVNSYYVVVQHFPKRAQSAAEAARDFLQSRGVPCVIRVGAGDLELVAIEGFATEQQAQDLVRRILELGKEYWNSGGGYNFLGAKARRF